ncbi:YjbF family lipoprotein [Elioraea tepidiphila]|mgnify:CR=1 FL=1|jgi:hypothetical protein|uniref:YjbF family lipoprotein n=1 Tax=Elioraea tepidiphila TaxID=457934 RepID=UPI002FD99D92
MDRRGFALVLALTLTGCGTGGELLRALGDTVLPDENPPVTREQAEALPYASAVVRLGARRPAFVVLHSAQGGRLIWLSADRVAVVTEGGRVVALAGVEGALTDTRFRDGAPPKPLGLGQHLRLVDVAPAIWGLPVACTGTALGPETITVLGEARPTERVAESCAGEDGTRFTDRFWIGPEDGQIWRAQQWIGPGRPAITFELVRPPTMP